VGTIKKASKDRHTASLQVSSRDATMTDSRIREHVRFTIPSGPRRRLTLASASSATQSSRTNTLSSASLTARATVAECTTRSGASVFSPSDATAVSDDIAPRLSTFVRNDEVPHSLAQANVDAPAWGHRR
jgi:hypothetical protein